MPNTGLSFRNRWQNSVVFRLGAMMLMIVAFIAVTQASVGFQIYRLNKTQDAFLEQSVPLLDKSQQFARLMTTTLSQTAQLDEYLSAANLMSLRTAYSASEAQSALVLSEIEALSAASDKTSDFRESRNRFTQINTQLFENQLAQRQMEETRQALTFEILQTTTSFKDLIDQMLVRSTTQILSIPRQFESGTPMDRATMDLFVRFAGDNETLNSLRSHIIDVDNLMRSQRVAVGVPDEASYEDQLKFRVRSIAQSLHQLQDSAERQKLAALTADLNRTLSAPTGYLAVSKQIQASHEAFSELKLQQIEAVGDVDREVEMIVKAATTTFQSDISLADRSIGFIMWIGLATTALVILGMYLLNRYVVQKQISERFTTLTEDVLEISKGNYEHQVRVTGTDEFGDIATSLNVFKDQAVELLRSNAELERFAYVAAHDLRSPLDAIQDLAKWTLEDAGDTLDPDSKSNLVLLIKRTARLSTLQQDLLTYARAGKQAPQTDVFHVREEVAKISDMVDPQNHYKISVINDPGKVVSYATPLRQVLINLVTNAIKHHDKDTGTISVIFSRHNGMLRFEVEDDGPGIAAKYQGQIFELFKTLKSRDRVEGSGLGLALVSKLATRFGGSIRVHSDAPDKRGTRFIFEIPDMEPEVSVEGPVRRSA